jgi:hypothetical protein
VEADGVDDCLDAGRSLPVPVRHSGTSSRAVRARTAGLRSLADGGEWQELVDVLIASLAMTQTRVTSSECDELKSLAEAMDLPTDQLAGLNVQD